jgi:geranylgeranyl reductase family protein
MTDRIPNEMDALVVGAGPAGSTAARRLAQAGRRVVVVERLAAPNVGRKVCGNALAEDGLEAVSRHIDPPSGPEIARLITGGELVLRDVGTTVRIPKSGAVLNRLVFGQRLLADAVSAGALLADLTACVAWSDRDRSRVRLRGHDGEESDVSARIVIDASGYRGVLTRDGGPSHTDPLGRDEVAIGYREIVPLREPLPDPDSVLIALGPPGAERGYAWIFPMGARLANVGIGTLVASAPDGWNGHGSAPAAPRGNELRRAFAGFVESREDLRPGEALDAGTGLLPLRRPLATFVGDGFLSVGDAACQTNPLHGGGITPSIIAASLAADTAIDALDDGDTSTEALWPYNVRFMRDLGARHAAHEGLRLLLHSLTADEFRFLATELLGVEGMARAFVRDGAGRGVRDAFGLLGRAIRRPGLAATFLRAARLIAVIEDHYGHYPETPARFESWLGQAEYHRRALRRLTRGGGA